MEAKELRIENLVNIKSHADEVGISAIGISQLKKGKLEVEPIPLTVEKLIEFGFEYKEDLCRNGQDYYNGYIKNGFRIALIGDEFAYWIDIEDYYYSFPLRKIKYCHKLQNLYFEIKDEELI